MNLKKYMATSLGVDEGYIDIISRKNNMYVKYYVNKRRILHPAKELKVLQRWLVNNIFVHYPISPYSKAYSKGDSVKKNAYLHRNANHILHMDISHFFPSITREMLIDFFDKNTEINNRLELEKNDIDLILDICLYQGKTLVIGSPASPYLSNIFMYDFDFKLYDMLSSLGTYTYTRYADDIVISSPYFISEEVPNMVRTLITQYGFSVNEKKIYFMSRHKKRHVTGVVIDNQTDELTIGEKKYREIKRKIYTYLIKGEGDISYILGYLSYIKDINENQYLQLKTIYKKYDKKQQIFKD